jgi:GT2 family glycosyltransferase
VTAPWLSVIVPTFDGAGFVADALDSVVAEDHEGIQVVVVDDGSTDETVAIVRRYAGRVDLDLDTSGRRRGWVAATNAGLRRAAAERVALLHQDDVWLPGRVAAVRRLLAAHPRAALHVHAARFRAPDGRDLGPWSLPVTEDAGVLPSAAAVERLLVQNWLCVAAPVFGRDDALAGGGLDEALWYTADWDLWLRLARTGDVAFDAGAYVGFRLHPASQTASRSADAPAFRAQLETVVERHRPPTVGADVVAAASASVELNVALAAISHGRRPPLAPLARALVRLRPASLRRLRRDSRLRERVGARLRQRRHDRRG